MRVVDDREFPSPRFASLDDRDGLEIFDPVEKARFELWTDGSVDPEGADPDAFAFPLDSAATIETTRIEIPRLADVMIRDPDGNYLGRYSTARERAHFEPAPYNVELTTTPMKLYLLADSALDVSRTDHTTVIVDFGGPTEVRVGARSFYERPAGTVTITEDETDLMAAVSLFGSALKTTSPERSFPTMRGHPPRIERGDTYGVSKTVEPVDTGVTILVPAERRAIFAVAPLAFYLGATLEEGPRPRLIAGGVDETLPRPSFEPSWDREADEFEVAVNRLLQRVFFFDCLARTEGLYQFPLHERESFEADLGREFDLDFAYLYDQSIPTQLDAYLSVPYEKIRSYLPAWNLLVDLVAAPEQDAILPYVANDLSLVRCTPPPERRTRRPEDEYTTEVLGLDPGDWKPVNRDNPDVHDLSLEGYSFESLDGPAIEQAYAGDGYPLGSNKLTLRGFENRLGEPRPENDSITVHVVVNDATLKSEDIVFHVWNDRNLLDFEVHRHEWPDEEELIEILETPCDFLHYVGRASSEGLYAQNDLVPFPDVHDLGAKAFFVQGCEDFGDVSWMMARGAYGGIVSTTQVEDMRHGDDLLVMGRWVSRLLNQGFTLRSAMVVAEEVLPDRMDWTIIGDGGISLVETESVQPYLVNVSSVSDSEYDVSWQLYPSASKNVGAIWCPNHSQEHTTVHLTPGTLPSIKISHTDLIKYLNSQRVPVLVDDKYVWSDHISIERYLD